MLRRPCCLSGRRVRPSSWALVKEGKERREALPLKTTLAQTSGRRWRHSFALRSVCTLRRKGARPAALPGGDFCSRVRASGCRCGVRPSPSACTALVSWLPRRQFGSSPCRASGRGPPHGGLLAGSLHRGRSAPRAGPETSRVPAYGAGPRAPHPAPSSFASRDDAPRWVG